jgi:DNA-binding beta-propeller fold protein YncE
MRHPALALVVFVFFGACATTSSSVAPPRGLRPIDLPGRTEDGVGMDYLAFDHAHHRVWVPAGQTGSVDVIDVPSGEVHRVEGFVTQEVERRGQKRRVGPSSATVGEGMVYVGNRGDSSVCAVDAVSLARGACVKLDSSPDGLAYVAARHEVWVTTPRAKSIVVLDVAAGALKPVATIQLDGEPEGYAVDPVRPIFYTNLEDKDRTLAIATDTRQVVATWEPGCGEDGPKGLAFDAEDRLLAVACTDHVELLDAGHDGRIVDKLETGAGVDNIDYIPARRELFVAAGRAATLTVAHIEPVGKLVRLALIPTAEGARNAVADDSGRAFVTDSRRGRILEVTR